MNICFAYYARKFIPKGDVLQFLHMVKALDQRMHRSRSAKKLRHGIDCVLPFSFENGQHGFRFTHTHFHKSKDIVKKIVSLDEKVNYDFIFIRGRREALNLIKKNPKLSSKLLYLCIHYDQENKEMMKEMTYLFKNSRVMFFQSIPWADRFKAYMHKLGIPKSTLDKKVKVLPQYVDSLPEEEIHSIKRHEPLQLIQAGVIRPRYGLPVALRAVQHIRKHFRHVHLHLIYPSLNVEKEYKETVKKLLKAKEIVDHGELSVLETKRKIVSAGIGLALIYDDTTHRSPTYSYLSRILDYLSLGVPVLTMKTPGNVHLMGEGYPLYVKNEEDIVRCYDRLQDPTFYKQISDYCKSKGRRFISEVAVEEFWSILKLEKKSVK